MHDGRDGLGRGVRRRLRMGRSLLEVEEELELVDDPLSAELEDEDVVVDVSVVVDSSVVGAGDACATSDGLLGRDGGCGVGGFESTTLRTSSAGK